MLDFVSKNIASPNYFFVFIKTFKNTYLNPPRTILTAAKYHNTNTRNKHYFHRNPEVVNKTTLSLDVHLYYWDYTINSDLRYMYMATTN